MLGVSKRSGTKLIWAYIAWVELKIYINTEALCGVRSDTYSDLLAVEC